MTLPEELEMPVSLLERAMELVTVPPPPARKMPMPPLEFAVQFVTLLAEIPASLLETAVALLTLDATMPLAPLPSGFEFATESPTMPLLPLELAQEFVTLPLAAEIPIPPFENARQCQTLASLLTLIPIVPFWVALTSATTACSPAYNPLLRQPEIRR